MNEVIKSFLVGLGFGVDETTLAKFNKAITSASIKVAALYTSTQLMAGAIVKGISSISESFEQMGYEYKIISPAINKALILRNELLKAYSAAGINIQKTVIASVKLNMSLTKTKFALEAIYKSVGSRFFGLLTKQSDLFRQKIYANMPKIQEALEKFVKIVFKAFEATYELGFRLWSILTRVYDFFVKLDKATDGWSTIILGVVAAWKYLNLAFLATPLGMLLAGLTAILALYDDFEVWKEGGKSFFNWTDAVPAIEATKKVLSDLWNLMTSFVPLFKELATGDMNSFWDRMKSSAFKFWEVLKDIWDLFGKLGKFLDIQIDKAFGTNLQNNPIGAPISNPVGSNIQNAQTNQNVNQQTNINVMGSADAKATGIAVASEQTQVNFNLTRNLKGAVR